MIINKLQFQAFGPYPTKQVIDFDQINKNKIFLITGPTGAGKTTIFDAISYALFAEATSKNRENKTLRSHHASDDIETNVELVFTISSKQYKIFRAPKQTTLGRGGKLVEREAKVALTMPDGKVYEKSQEVEKELEKIFKLKSNQFKQIVMLAQGEFQKMLFATSSEREEIFRKVFGTEKIKAFQDELKSDLEAAKKEATIKSIKLEEIIKAFNFDTIPTTEYIKALGKDSPFTKEIEEKIEQDLTQTKNLKQTINTLKLQIDDAIATQTKMIKLNDSFNELEQLQLEKVKLDNQKQDIAKLQDVVNKLAKLPLLDEYKKQVDENTKQLEKQTNTLGNLEKQAALLKLDIEETQAAISKKEIQKSNLEKDAAIKNYTTLKPMLESFKAYDTELITITQLQLNLDKTTNLLNINTLKQTETNNKIKAIRQELDSLKSLLEKEVVIVNEHLKVSQEYEESCKLIEKYQEYTTKYSQYQNFSEKYTQVSSEIANLQKNIIDLELAKERNYLGVIAKTLHDNDPCPLCGSLHHPNLATTSDCDYDELIKKTKAELEQKTQVKDQIVQNITESKTIFSRLKEEIDKTLDTIRVYLPNQNIESIENYSKNLATKKESLGVEVNIINNAKETTKAKQKLLDSLEEDTKKITNELNSLEKQKAIFDTNIASSKSFINKIKASLPANYVSAKQLESEIASNENEQLALAKELNDLIINQASLIASTAQLKETIEANNKTIEEAKNKLQLANIQFTNKINEVFENEDEYYQLIKNKASLKTYEESINKYIQNVASNNALLSKALNETSGYEKPNLDIIAAEISKMQQENDEINAKLVTLHNTIDANKKNLKKFNDSLIQAIDADNYWKMIANLEEQASGRKTKVSFERFILSTSFEKMLMHASIRLKAMTNGRYSFTRREEKYGTANQGLDINIFDFKTSKERDVKSLSGGETFKASLALSMGLSDVIQQRIGTINIDTLFVDEGFGSLDSESLDSAIQTLYELVKTGKVIGIISHVQEVKNRIESKIVISQTNLGSTISKIE